MQFVSTKRMAALYLLSAGLTYATGMPVYASHTDPPLRSAARQAPRLTGLETLENGIIKVGVDGRYGGAITYLSAVGGENMVNNFDLGRQVQISLFGGPLDFSRSGHPVWAGLGWNPIQAGDTYNNPGEVVDFQKQPDELYVKTIPKLFALPNVSGEATIEHWVRLSGNVVKVHVRLVINRADKRQFDARTQEFPCLYLNAPYNNVYAYQGNNPYGNGNMTKLTPPMEMEYLRPVTEPWIAATNNEGFGVGLFVPYNYQWTKAFFGDELKGDEFSGNSTYIANTRFEILDHNLTHEWDYELIVGNINDIRSHVYNQPRLPATINYRFDVSRKGFYYTKATDTGWPVQNQLHVMVDNAKEGQIHSPVGFWRGRDNKTMYVRAAFQGQSDKYRLHWRQLADKDFYGIDGRYVDFPITNDGQMRTYAIDLSGVPGWVDQDIVQFAVRPRWDGPAVNGWVKLEFISTNPDATPPPKTPPSTNKITEGTLIPPKNNPPVTPPVVSQCVCPVITVKRTR